MFKEDKSFNVEILCSSAVKTIEQLILSSNILLGSILSLFNIYEDKIEKENMLETLNEHKEQLALIRDILLNTVYMNSPEYVKDLLYTLRSAKDELNQEKRKTYATYLTACCLNENSESINKRIFLDYIEKLEPIDLHILNYVSPRVNECTNIYAFYKRCENSGLKYTIEDIEIHFQYLASLGIIEMKSDEELKKLTHIGHIGNSLSRACAINRKYHEIYVRATLGNKFFKFITLPTADCI